MGGTRAGTSVSLKAITSLVDAEVGWIRVDGPDDEENTFVEMTDDKSVAVGIFPAESDAPEPTRAPNDGSSPTPTPAPFQLPTPTPTPAPSHSCAPLLISPEDGAILDNGSLYLSDGIVWDFDWSDCAGATAYQLYVKEATRIYPVINNSNLALSSYHHDRPASYIDDLHRHNLTWKVRALVGGQWGEWSETRSFDVEPVERSSEAHCGSSQIGNHTPPSVNHTTMTFALDARDPDHGIGPGVDQPDGGYAVSAWFFAKGSRTWHAFGDAIFVEYAPGLFAFGGEEEDFSLITGSNSPGQIGTYQLNVRSNFLITDATRGYYFRIEDQKGDVTYIGAGGQQFASDRLVQANTIPFGSGTINFS